MTLEGGDGYFYSIEEETTPIPSYIVTADDDSDMLCRRCAKQKPAIALARQLWLACAFAGCRMSCKPIGRIEYAQVRESTI